MIRVLLVDDQRLIREGLRRILEPEADMTIVGECEDGDEVVDLVTRSTPDVVLMDIRMRRIDGATATRHLRDAGDNTPVLVLTTFDDDDTVALALSAGASGFVLKDAPGEQIQAAVRSVAAGESWLDPRVTGSIIESFRAHGPSRTAPPPEFESLTARERDVLLVLAEGASNAEIAARLIVSEATAKTHLSSVLTKLGVRDRAAAIVWAHRHSIIDG